MNEPEKISLLLIEDDALIAHSLSLLLTDLGYAVVAVCNTYESGLEALDNYQYDLIISDINLGYGINEKSGLILMSYAREIKNCPFIFLTAFSDTDTLREAASIKPSAYLVKPVTEANLHAAIQIAIENFKTPQPVQKTGNSKALPEYFFVKLGNNFLRISWRGVHSLEALKNYVRICTNEHKAGVLVRGSLQHVINNLIPSECIPLFIRVSRSMYIARDAIKEIGDGCVITEFGKVETTMDIAAEFVKGKQPGQPYN